MDKYSRAVWDLTTELLSKYSLKPSGQTASEDNHTTSQHGDRVRDVALAIATKYLVETNSGKKVLLFTCPSPKSYVSVLSGGLLAMLANKSVNICDWEPKVGDKIAPRDPNNTSQYMIKYLDKDEAQLQPTKGKGIKKPTYDQLKRKYRLLNDNFHNARNPHVERAEALLSNLTNNNIKIGGKTKPITIFGSISAIKTHDELDILCDIIDSGHNDCKIAHPLAKRHFGSINQAYANDTYDNQTLFADESEPSELNHLLNLMADGTIQHGILVIKGWISKPELCGLSVLPWHFSTDLIRHLTNYSVINEHQDSITFIKVVSESIERSHQLFRDALYDFEQKYITRSIPLQYWALNALGIILGNSKPKYENLLIRLKDNLKSYIRRAQDDADSNEECNLANSIYETGIKLVNEIVVNNPKKIEFIKKIHHKNVCLLSKEHFDLFTNQDGKIEDFGFKVWSKAIIKDDLFKENFDRPLWVLSPFCFGKKLKTFWLLSYLQTLPNGAKICAYKFEEDKLSHLILLQQRFQQLIMKWNIESKILNIDYSLLDNSVQKDEELLKVMQTVASEEGTELSIEPTVGLEENLLAILERAGMSKKNHKRVDKNTEQELDLEDEEDEEDHNNKIKIILDDKTEISKKSTYRVLIEKDSACNITQIKNLVVGNNIRIYESNNYDILLFARQYWGANEVIERYWKASADWKTKLGQYLSNHYANNRIGMLEHLKKNGIRDMNIARLNDWLTVDSEFGFPKQRDALTCMLAAQVFMAPKVVEEIKLARNQGEKYKNILGDCLRKEIYQYLTTNNKGPLLSEVPDTSKLCETLTKTACITSIQSA